MKYYMASYNGSVSDGMQYKEHGGEKDVFQLFPELKAIIKRLPLRTIDFRMANGDRFRIYNIHLNKSLSPQSTAINPPQMAQGWPA
ncbi:MAG: hypothetical protein PVI58_04105 [Desulfobacterales bacterium]|jgi:hypothetical protein